MSSPIKVTHVVLSLDVGGTERVVLALIRQGLLLGQEVAAVCLEQPGTLSQEVEALGVRVTCLDKPHGLQLRVVKALREAFRALRTDIIHTHQITALFYAGPAARQVGLPVVHTEHGKNFTSRRMRWVGWLAGRWTRRFFCVSQDIADHVKHFGIVAPSKIRVVPNGIDPRTVTEPAQQRLAVGQSLRIPPGAPVIGTVGRLDEVKRQDVLLHAFARVKRRFPQAHLLVVGDGPLQESLQALAAYLGLGDSAHFVGYQARPGMFLQAMDVFALTSWSEGMPLSILEAWATGLPVVASDVGGLPELVQAGSTGLLCPCGDIGATAAALEALLADPALRQRLGEAGREVLARHYTVQTMARAYEEEYLQLCGPAHPHSGH